MPEPYVIGLEKEKGIDHEMTLKIEIPKASIAIEKAYKHNILTELFEDLLLVITAFSTSLYGNCSHKNISKEWIYRHLL